MINSLTAEAAQIINQLPEPSGKRLALHITKQAQAQIRSGHPWLFDQAIQKQSHPGTAGDLAVIFDQKKKFLAVGLYDPDSPLRVKVLQHNKPATIDQNWFREKLQQAVDLRAPLAAQQTTGYRLVYGEGDGLPGIIIDRYADTLVIKVYSAAWLPHFQMFLSALDEVTESGRWVLRLSRTLQANSGHGLTDGLILRGEPLTEPVPFLENGLRFAADVVHGHKTGFFFDHRDNRQRVGRLAKGKRVLDVFAYSGGFSTYAAVGGATEVTSLDISRPALEAAVENVRRNAPEVNHTTLAEDAFEALEKLIQKGERYELVVVDPPSFAKSQKEVERAIVSYGKLTRLAVRLVSNGGILVMASCSSRVKSEQFFDTVFDTADEMERPLWEHFRTTHALDHPTREGFPEGAYLKCLYASPID